MTSTSSSKLHLAKPGPETAVEAAVEPVTGPSCPPCAVPEPPTVPEGIAEWEEQLYFETISVELSEEQCQRIATPARSYPHQEAVLAVHWHPEFVPLDLIRQRIAALYPGSRQDLIIPTQHNQLMRFDHYWGVEVDCYSRGFNRKVQLLVHLAPDKVEQADTFKAMLSHTFKYRSSQLFEFMHALTDPAREAKLSQIAAETNTDSGVVAFARAYTAKVQKLLEIHWDATPADSVKNKLLRNYLDGLRSRYGDSVVARAQVFLKAVKEEVKRRFSLEYFYRASEIIEEVRGLGGGIVIPHPEQFWPILLADYDVDGIEVWNPQSSEYTEFLVSAVNRQNQVCKRTERPVLIFMGDDCHMSEKAKDPALQDPEKAAREIGLQPAWDDLRIRKSLIVAQISRERVIEEYTARLG